MRLVLGLREIYKPTGTGYRPTGKPYKPTENCFVSKITFLAKNPWKSSVSEGFLFAQMNPASPTARGSEAIDRMKKPNNTILADSVSFLMVRSNPFLVVSKHRRKIKTADQLDRLIEDLSPAEGIKYLFIDEIQNVKDFEEVINGYREEEEYSIFITGSNSYLLSGELATKLTGRYLEFELYTLSFDEYLGMKAFLGKTVQNDLTAEFDLYLAEGGFPKALEYWNDPDYPVDWTEGEFS